MDTMADVWKEVLSICKNKVSETMYTMWLEPLELVKFENNTFVFTISTGFKKTIVLSKFSDVLKESFEEVMGFPVDIDILVSDKPVEKKEEKKPEAPTFHSRSLTFENFVVGKSNDFAYSVSVGVAKNPGVLHNPLLIYGRSGLGKTHLLSAIENELKKNNPDMVVIYATGEGMMNEFFELVKVKNTESFRQKYRNADALLVDDIQWIQRSESLQDEFFNTFDALKRKGSQVVMTSDVPPREMEVFTDRLRSRIEQGVMVDVQPPDFDTRKAIIIKKCEQLGTELPEPVIEVIAQRVRNNIRQIEGTVNKIAAMKAAYNREITLEQVEEIIKDITTESQPVSVKVEKIIDYIAKAFGVTAADVKSEKRQSNIAMARQISIYVISEVTDLTQKQIGEFFGKTHSNVNYSINQAKENMAQNPQAKVVAIGAIGEFQNKN
jgi:chromosomal replication initiator protein